MRKIKLYFVIKLYYIFSWIRGSILIEQIWPFSNNNYTLMKTLLTNLKKKDP